MIPQRYIIATLFIAAMLLLFAVVQAPRPVSAGGVTAVEAPAVMNLGGYESLAELRLVDGWAPRFQGTLDPDQSDPWPFEGGFGTPWEPASPYLGDQGLALNGPQGRSEVVLWRGLEWRRYRFDAPLASARLDPAKGSRLLVTLQMGEGRFETRLLEVPEGRVIWSTESGPWSRFSWDGKAVLLGRFEKLEPRGESRLLLSTLSLEADPGEATLAAWDEPGLPPPPRSLATKAEALSDDGRDLPGARLELPWHAGDRLWFPRADRLWHGGIQGWSAWVLQGGRWRRAAAGQGLLTAHPPQRMALVAVLPDEGMARRLSPVAEVEWTPVPDTALPWPAWDAAWAWRENGAFDAWDQRWNESALPPERQRQALYEAYRPEWRTALNLRASVKGWLPGGPEVALREPLGVAWVWVGDRVLLVRLVEAERVRLLKKLLR
ncbi:hypothetical protein [Geothrix edaphica]|uniref:Uncharacterized protein n=1 Tax=Geothrix edaphica TaxID=2927976 RepID=A0ABQ5PYD7_9BACT|nr:hypothetical protein [Geothrix edaphica]GLH67477.1 hypothetical protein GETHED_18410 [Geothrix edaphica]